MVNFIAFKVNDQLCNETNRSPGLLGHFTILSVYQEALTYREASYICSHVFTSLQSWIISLRISGSEALGQKLNVDKFPQPLFVVIIFFKTNQIVYYPLMQCPLFSIGVTELNKMTNPSNLKWRLFC